MANENITLPIKKIEAKLKRALVGVPQIMGNEALNFALDNFKNKGFQGSSFQRWKKRKDPSAWGDVSRPGRAMLVDTGRLRRSGHVAKINNKGVALEWAVPYAKTHNEGLNVGQIQTIKGFTRKRKGKTHNVKSFTRRFNQKIPKRQFIGASPYLSKRVVRHASAHLMKHLKR